MSDIERLWSRGQSCYAELMKHILCVIALLAPVSAVADVVGPNGKTIDCYCTDTQGARVELGETICLYVDGRAFMAQCQMSLNVPMWREVQDSCLSSRLQDVQPALNTVSVYPKI